jgi:hypothetical protein
MPFDITTRTVLEYYTAHPPATEDVWYGPWTTILTTLFPSTQGYLVTPQRRLPDDPESHIPDFIIEVVKLSSPPLTFRSVLIVDIKNAQRWQPLNDSSIDRLTLPLPELRTQRCTGSGL